MGNVIVVVLLILAIVALVFGFNCGIAWLTQCVVYGLFDYELPFWPTVGAVWLVQVVLGVLRGNAARVKE